MTLKYSFVELCWNTAWTLQLFARTVIHCSIPSYYTTGHSLFSHCFEPVVGKLLRI